MKTIFLLAFEFPPLNRGGTQRPLKFVKYLGDFGIKPVVFTLMPTDYEKVFLSYFSDSGTTSDIPDNCDVVRVPIDDITGMKGGRLRSFLRVYFSIVAREGEAWREHLFPIIADSLPVYRPTAIVATTPPYSMAVLAVKLSKKHNLPLILDMRDSWSGRNISQYGSIFHYWATLFLERHCFKQAKYVIVTSDQTMDDFIRLHPKVERSKFKLITNGYDRQIDEWKIRDIDPEKETIIVGYSGSFHHSPEARKMIFTPWYKRRGHRMLQYTPNKEDWFYQTPYYFFRTVKRLFERDPTLSNRLKIHFAGEKPDWIDEMIDSFGLRNNVRLFGQLSLKESLKFQESCDVLLVTSAKLIGGHDYAIAGKTYEYISMRKPIVGFVSEGAQKRILENIGIAVVCDPDDIEDSASKLETLLRGLWKANPNVSFLKKLHRKQLTKHLAELINEIG